MDCGDLPPVAASSPPARGGDGGIGKTQATATSACSESAGEGCDALARAIFKTLGAVLTDFDTRAEGTARSQDELAISIDRLTGELDKLLEDAPLPFIMQHATKISSIRKRVSALNLLLKSIQRRIDNIDRMLSTGTPIGKVPPDIVETSSLTL